MTTPHLPRPGSAPAPGAEPADAIPPRLAHLFRASLREGRLHPLMFLVRRYRAEAAR